jgi:predicted short-subunit dehydrogenase-like oxidoreductase (DUF2520 family)
VIPPAVRIIGPGRAGTSLAWALTDAGWEVAPLVGRRDDPREAAVGVDMVVLATPDDTLPAVAAAVEPIPTTLFVHLAGSRSLDVLAPHARRASVHPLVALPTPEIGAKRLVGAWYAVAGDPEARRIVEALGGRPFAVDDADRALYHATAVVASNHLVALMGQVERLAAAAGVPFAAYLDLAAETLDNVRDLGPAAALTGPAARGDEATIERHLADLPEGERAAYRALADAARRLAAERGADGTDTEPEPGDEP